MTSTQVVETSVTNNSSFQNYTHLDDHTIRTTDTPGFKPFSIEGKVNNFWQIQKGIDSFLFVLNFQIICYSTSRETETKTPLSRIPLFLYCAAVTSGFIPEDGTNTSPWGWNSMDASQVGINPYQLSRDKKVYDMRRYKNWEVIYQTGKTVFHRILKHRGESWKYEAQRSVYDELRGVSKCGQHSQTLFASFFVSFSPFIKLYVNVYIRTQNSLG